jgi:hypothetical protein
MGYSRYELQRLEFLEYGSIGYHHDVGNLVYLGFAFGFR